MEDFPRMPTPRIMPFLYHRIVCFTLELREQGEQARDLRDELPRSQLRRRLESQPQFLCSDI